MFGQVVSWYVAVCVLLSVRHVCYFFADVSVWRLQRPSPTRLGQRGDIDAAGAAPPARDPVSVPPRCNACLLLVPRGLWHAPEAVRPARGAAFEPEARQLSTALAPRERKTTAKPLRAAEDRSKAVLCFVQTRSRTSLQPF